MIMDVKMKFVGMRKVVSIDVLMLLTLVCNAHIDAIISNTYRTKQVTPQFIHCFYQFLLTSKFQMICQMRNYREHCFSL